MVPSDRYKTVPRGARRDAIEAGWTDFKACGWQAEPRFPAANDQHWFWLNGMEAAEQDRRGCNIDKRTIPGWR
jgi:hypothetical protein